LITSNPQLHPATDGRLPYTAPNPNPIEALIFSPERLAREAQLILHLIAWRAELPDLRV
jgi:hypothetical protein